MIIDIEIIFYCNKGLIVILNVMCFFKWVNICWCGEIWDENVLFRLKMRCYLNVVGWVRRLKGEICFFNIILDKNILLVGWCF